MYIQKYVLKYYIFLKSQLLAISTFTRDSISFFVESHWQKRFLLAYKQYKPQSNTNM